MKKNYKSSPKLFYSSYKPRPEGGAGRGVSFTALRPVIIAAIIILGFFFIQRLPVFVISDVEVEGKKQEEIKEKLSSLKGTSLFSGKINRRIDDVKSHDLEIEELTCRKGIPATLHCTVTMREAVMSWKAGEKTFLVDSLGFVFAEGESVNDVVISDGSNTALKIGDMVASSEIVETYSGLHRSLSEKGLVVDSLAVEKSLYMVTAYLSGSTSSNIPFPSTSSLKVLFTTSYPIALQVDALEKFLQQRSSNVSEYLDVRVAGYLYYK
jgi:hypothetical protein